MLQLKAPTLPGFVLLLVACSGALAAACGESSDGPGPVATAGSAGNAGSAGTLAGAAGTAGNAGTAMSGAPSNGGASGSAGTNAGGNVTGGSAGAAGAASVGSCTPPVDVFSPVVKLTETGCVDLANPTKPNARAVKYEVNSPLWSDSADKTRAFVLPAGGKIHVRDCKANAAECPNGAADDGRWDFPVGSVMIKTFGFDDKLLETRLFMRVSDSDWAGYSYQWNEAQTEATLVSEDGATVNFQTGKRSVDWHYPSQKDCLNCHNAAGGSTLGPETAQMNRMVGGVNQIDQLAALFETAPAKPYKAALVTPTISQAGSPPEGATVEQKARSYLHANCGFCHRPGGNYPNFDFRYDTPLKDMSICNADVKKGAIASAPGKTKILVPGLERDSVMWLRMNEADPIKGRMPQIASYAVDHDATTVVGDWIKSIATCP